jgi:hypothetical protein
MASTVTLTNLIEQVRQRADMENTTFVTDAEITTYINSGCQDLYDILLKKYEDYYTISGSVVTDGIADTFALPAGFYKLIGVDYYLSGLLQPMERFNFEDRYKYRYNAQVLRYRIIKNSLKIIPVPPAQTLTIWYAPAFTPLVTGSDTFDGINGWEDVVVVDAAMKCLKKEESDISQLLIEKQELTAKIEEMAFNRDQGRPEVVADVVQYRLPYQRYFGDE